MPSKTHECIEAIAIVLGALAVVAALSVVVGLEVLP